MHNTPATPAFVALYLLALGLYGLYVAAELFLPRYRKVPLALGVALHVAGMVLRGLAVGYFPLTNKFESFYAFALAAMAVALGVQRSPSRVHRLGVAAVGLTFYALTSRFGSGTAHPPPLMLTPWYPLHVPASFLAYALWTSAATAGLAALLGARDERVGRATLEHAFWGWCAFSLSMIFGGAWGYVAWGAYFLWDPKVLWSVVLWLFYSGFVHVRYWPWANQPRVRAALALVGFVAVLVAYVGTSFLFGHGSHSFS